MNANRSDLGIVRLFECLMNEGAKCNSRTLALNLYYRLKRGGIGCIGLPTCGVLKLTLSGLPACALFRPGNSAKTPEDNAKQNTTVTYFYDTLTYLYTGVIECATLK
jgi:hypothetical protein